MKLYKTRCRCYAIGQERGPSQEYLRLLEKMINGACFLFFSSVLYCYRVYCLYTTGVLSVYLDITRGTLLLLIRCQHRRSPAEFAHKFQCVMEAHPVLLCVMDSKMAHSLSFFLIFIILSWSILEYSGVLWSLVLANAPTRSLDEWSSVFC